MMISLAACALPHHSIMLVNKRTTATRRKQEEENREQGLETGWQPRPSWTPEEGQEEDNARTQRLPARRLWPAFFPKREPQQTAWGKNIYGLKKENGSIHVSLKMPSEPRCVPKGSSPVRAMSVHHRRPHSVQCVDRHVRSSPPSSGAVEALISTRPQHVQLSVRKSTQNA